jgi:NAD(P)-dependent dehydrogenase (short-subunit alcohol dehydrogenase family)
MSDTRKNHRHHRRQQRLRRGGRAGLRRPGDRVWGTMRDTEGRNAAKKAELEGYSPRITIAEMDVTSDASVADGFARILAEGPVDILINNAGIMYIGMTEAYSVAQAAEQMDTNYFGAIRAMQAVLPSMRAAGRA